MEYKIGLYGGAFNPLHMGHLSCIIQAANMCEKLYIIVCDAKKRDEINVRIKYRWIYQLTHHIGNVKIIILPDNCEHKEKYSNDEAIEDARYIKETVAEPIDVVFYGDDYGDDSFWKVCYPESEKYVFKRNGVSSSQIRDNVYAHWDCLPDVVKPYYVKKILITGGESTGKSTLAINLANYYNTNCVDEAGRELSAKSGTDTMMLREDFTEILLTQKLNQMKAERLSNKLLFVDTDATITRFFLEFLDGENAEKNIQLSKALDSLNEYDLILFLEPDVPFVQDGDRSEIIHADRKKYSDQIKKLLDDCGRKYLCIGGSYQDRFVRAVEETDKLIN